MSDLTFVAGDGEPSVYGTLTDPVTGLPFDLSGATVRFQMRLATDRRFTVDAIASVTGLSTAGTVRYDWNEGDLDTAGDYVARWQVTFADGSIQHTDPSNTITVAPE